jgi:predicted TIM-barrel fold metal-dependent hydrolase
VIVDSLAFLGTSIFGYAVDPHTLLARLDEAGIDRAVAAPVKPRAYDLRGSNEVVAEAVREHPDRLVGLVRVDPLLGDDARSELERGLDELGLRGLFLHPWEETFCVSDERVADLLHAAAEHDVPVVIAAGYPWLSEGLQVGDLASRFSGVRIVATGGLQINMSGLGQTDAELALADNDNLHVLTTGVYREDFIRRVVERHGPGRVLFASGLPQFDPRLEIRRVQWAGFSEPEQDALLRGNAERLFWG